MARVKRQSYYVNATNEAGTMGERPEIVAASPEEAMNIYRQEYGHRFPVLEVVEKIVIDDDPDLETKKSSPVNG